MWDRQNSETQQIENDVAELRPDSAVIQLNATHRQCHLASILPSSELLENQDVRTPIDFRVYIEAAGYLAMQHFNERNPRVLPHLPQTLADCNVQLSMELRDSRFSPIYAAQHLQEILLRATQTPVALVGEARSAVSQTLSILAGVYELPQISASSTSAALDNKDSSPFFARTVPTNSNDAKATILYLHSLGVSHLGVLFIQDEFGTAFHAHLLKEASKLHMTIVSSSFDESTYSIVTGIEQMRKSGVRYIMGIFNPKTWKTVVREAKRAGIIGSPEFSWLLSDASLELTQPEFRLDRDTEADLAAAVDGVGVVLLNVEKTASTAEFDKALSELETSPLLQEEYLNAHTEPGIFDGYEFRFPGPALYQYLNYDAVMALGIAACREPHTFFTGPELYYTLLRTQFEGVSGLVRFSNMTGTRDEQGVKYRIENVRLAANQTGKDFFEFSSFTSIALDFADANPIRTIEPFLYAGGSSSTPISLPELRVNLNLIPKGVRIAGLTLGSMTMLCGILWLAWTMKYRAIDVVRIAQPVFLCQLCLGAFIMASAIIPMSMQEPTSQRGLDFACMSTPWLLSVGFVTAFAALFSKARRLNLLFKNGVAFRRVKVLARDVIYPFLILMFLNVTILVVWTAVAPLRWRRVGQENFDQFGRSVESYGTCYGGGDASLQYVFASLILLVNIVAIAFLLYQSYKARNLPTEFNEGFYVTLTTFSLLESLLLAGPLLFVVYDNPTADFMIKSIIVTISCLAILLLMFIPKYLQRNIRALRENTQHERGGGRRSSVTRMSTIGDRFPQSSHPIREDPIEARAVVGKSTIKRSEDYYLQRGSTLDLMTRKNSMSNSSTTRRHRYSLPTSVSPQVFQSSVLASNTNTTTKTGWLFNKESDLSGRRSSESNEKPSTSFESAEPEFLPNVDAVQESLSSQMSH